jgi:hypothetical protein
MNHLRCCATLLLSMMLSATAAGATSVAVLPLAGPVDAPTRAAWTVAIREAVDGLEGYRALPAQAVTDALGTADALGSACLPTEVGCIARIGALATATIAIGGRIDPGPRGVALSFDVVEVNRATRLRYVVWSDTAAPSAPAMRLLAVRLLAPERERGWLIVRGALPGSIVSVDGAVVGTTPLPAPIELVPGPHAVVVDHIDRDAQAGDVAVSFGETTVFSVDEPRSADGARLAAREPMPDAAAAGVRVRIARISVGPDLPATVGPRLAEGLVASLRRTTDVIVVGDAAAAVIGAGTEDHGGDPGTVFSSVALVGDEATVIEDDDASRRSDVDIDVRVTRLGSAVVLSGRSVRLSPLRIRTYEGAVGDERLDRGLDRLGPEMLSAVLRDEAVGPVPAVADEGLPRWLWWATIAAGGASALVAGTAGSVWLADGGRDPGLGVVFVGSLAATAVLAAAAALEAPVIR